MNDYHLGSEIHNELIRQGRSVTWLAGQLNCNRMNVYDIFQRKSMDVELVARISLLLHRNFLKEISLHLDNCLADIVK